MEQDIIYISEDISRPEILPSQNLENFEMQQISSGLFSRNPESFLKCDDYV